MKNNSIIGRAIWYAILIGMVTLVFAVVCECQTAETQLLEIRNFRGLNTMAGDFQIQPNEARVCNNIDLGRKSGSISKRYGFEEIVNPAGTDSLVGMYGAYFSDGTQRMFYVFDWAATDYGRVLVGDPGTIYTGPTSVWNYFSVQNKPSFAMLDDNVYIVNGSHKGIVCNVSGDDVIARPYPLQAPGEPLIVPTTKSGPLDGEYRYTFRGRVYWGGGNWVTYSIGIVSSPLRVKNGQVLITRFQFVPSDSDITAAIDSIQIKPYRSHGDIGSLDLADTGFWIGDYWILKGSDIGDLLFYDSVADASLSTTDKYAFVEPGAWIGRDSSGTVDSRYGSPTFVSSDTTHPGDPDPDSTLDIFEGWPTKQKDTLGVVYVCTFIDTVTGIESDTGRSLFVFCDAGNSSPSYRQVNINLPKTIDTEDGIVVNLYRACIMQIGRDTSWIDILPPEPYEHGARWDYINKEWVWMGGPRKWQLEKYRKYIDAFIPETVKVIEYHLVGQFTVDDTLFTDSISYDSLSKARIYRKATAPPLMSKIFSYENRLFGIQKSGLYFTRPVYAEVIQSWGAMALTPINPDDGDMVTTAWPARGIIRVMKSYSNYNVYQDANLDWNKTEVSGYFGCVAPNSHAVGLGGHYYLSAEGVIRETEGMQLERTHQAELISAKLDNFDQYDIADLADAQGFYFDRKYLLCIGDTTYVYDERADGWSTWGFKFTSATLYSTEDELRFLPGDVMYFARPHTDRIYRYGTSETDAGGGSIDILWRSGPILADHRYKSIIKAGAWIDAATSSATLRNNWYNEYSIYQTNALFSPISDRYSVVSILPKHCLYYEYTLHTVSAGINEAFSVDGLDVWYKITGEKLVE